MAEQLAPASENSVSAIVQNNGGIEWLEWRNIRINMYAANPLEPPLANLWLRIYRDDAVAELHPLLGPTSGSVVSTENGTLNVTWIGPYLKFEAQLVLGENDFAWLIQVATAEAVKFDIIAVQDVALAPDWLVRMNEYYGAQYIDVTVLDGANGPALAFRQNQKFISTYPWLVYTSTDRVVGYATDLLDLAGISLRENQTPSGLWERKLKSRRLQHEHILGALQTEKITLQPGRSHELAVGAHLLISHDKATGESDLQYVAQFNKWANQKLTEISWSDGVGGKKAAGTLFGPAWIVPAEPVALDTSKATYVEKDDDGKPLSLFNTPSEHVVSREKELDILRPHGHLLRTGGKLLPEESVLTTTTTMGGLFASFLTQGHVAKDKMLSIGRGYLGHSRAAGLRVFVQIAGRWWLLDEPSVWTVTPGQVRWLYKVQQLEIQVTTTALTDKQEVQVEVEVIKGEPERFMFALNLALDGDDGLNPYQFSLENQGNATIIKPPAGSALAQRRPGGSFIIERTGAAATALAQGDGPLFDDGQSRGLPWVTITTEPTKATGLKLTATLVAAPEDVGEKDFWANALNGISIDAPSNEKAAVRLQQELPWLVNNALTHYLSPRGLEQYTGGGWGTRDVSQGPVELLLALGKYDELRQLLLMIFSAQGENGQWAQAFEIFPIDKTSPNGDSHGDVIFWPILAVGRYLEATGDGSILDEVVPFYDPTKPLVEGTLSDHLAKAITRAAELVVPGTHLAAYGHGDWNDSLQPANPAMVEGMTSSWTVTLHHQALETLANGLDRAGRAGGDELRADAEVILKEFQQELLPDGVLAGYGLADSGKLNSDGLPQMRYLLHPQDQDTGLKYSILPMIHAISDEMLTKEQAEKHVELINRYMLLPDGAHLFDKPPVYRGGPMEQFQRAESASYFGREIGTMYTHAHLRYAEAMAKMGLAQDLLKALDLANPVDTPAATPVAKRRQANTYFSSSDAAFADRYLASQGWDQVRQGKVDMEGGWRVYSSGPGILLRIIVECLLGIVRRGDELILDPVLVPGLDGMRVAVDLWGTRIEVLYHVGKRGFGPSRVLLDGEPVAATRLENRYREGGLAIRRADLVPLLYDGVQLEVDLP